MRLQYHRGKCKEIRPTSYLFPFKCGNMLCTLHRQRKANLPSLNSLLLEIPILQLIQKILHPSPTAGWSTKCLFFPFLKACLLQYFIKLTTFLQVYSAHAAFRSNQIIAVADLTWSEQGPGLDDPQASSSLSVLWGPWTFFKAPSCWMHVCSSYIRTLTSFTEWCNKIKLGHEIVSILMVLSSV